MYTRTYSNICPFDLGFVAPVALFTRGTRTRGWYVVALAQAHLRIQPTLIVAHRQHTVTLRVSTSGPIARSLNRKSCHSAIGADLLQLRNWTVLDHAVCHLFFIQNRQKERQHPRQ